MVNKRYQSIGACNNPFCAAMHQSKTETGPHSRVAPFLTHSGAVASLSAGNSRHRDPRRAGRTRAGRRDTRRGEQAYAFGATHSSERSPNCEDLGRRSRSRENTISRFRGWEPPFRIVRRIHACIDGRWQGRSAKSSLSGSSETPNGSRTAGLRIADADSCHSRPPHRTTADDQTHAARDQPRVAPEPAVATKSAIRLRAQIFDWRQTYAVAKANNF